MLQTLWDNSNSKKIPDEEPRVGQKSSAMRDAGLEQAIKAAVGCVASPGDRHCPAFGVAWSRIPAERVLAVEALTQVQRFILRPDLYGPSGQATVLRARSASISSISVSMPLILGWSVKIGAQDETLNLRQRLDGQHSFCRNARPCRHRRLGNADRPG